MTNLANARSTLGITWRRHWIHAYNDEQKCDGFQLPAPHNHYASCIRIYGISDSLPEHGASAYLSWNGAFDCTYHVPSIIWMLITPVRCVVSAIDDWMRVPPCRCVFMACHHKTRQWNSMRIRTTQIKLFFVSTLQCGLLTSHMRGTGKWMIAVRAVRWIVANNEHIDECRNTRK